MAFFQHEPSGAKSASSAAISPNRRQLPSAPSGKSGHNKGNTELKTIERSSTFRNLETFFS